MRRIGHGAMGEVWEAENVDTDRAVALKLITSPDPEVRRRLLREARAIGRLEHPNIVQILDRGESDAGEPFLVMQLLRGETLAARLMREHKLPEPVAAGIALDVARALRVAHEKQIVHRDLKPANIFLHTELDAEEHVVKVVDFGVSKLSIENEGGSTQAGGLVGSPAYMSPEQIRATGVDGRTDIWAVGVLLYEMVAGERPFNASNSVAVLTQILMKVAPRVESVAPNVTPAMGDVIAACLEREPARRVANAEELIRLLRPLAPRSRMATLQDPHALERFAIPEAPKPAPGPAQVSMGPQATSYSAPAKPAPVSMGPQAAPYPGPAKPAQVSMGPQAAPYPGPAKPAPVSMGPQAAPAVADEDSDVATAVFKPSAVLQEMIARVPAPGSATGTMPMTARPASPASNPGVAPARVPAPRVPPKVPASARDTATAVYHPGSKRTEDPPSVDDERPTAEILAKPPVAPPPPAPPPPISQPRAPMPSSPISAPRTPAPPAPSLDFGSGSWQAVAQPEVSTATPIPSSADPEIRAAFGGTQPLTPEMLAAARVAAPISSTDPRKTTLKMDPSHAPPSPMAAANPQRAELNSSAMLPPASPRPELGSSAMLPSSSPPRPELNSSAMLPSAITTTTVPLTGPAPEVIPMPDLPLRAPPKRNLPLVLLGISALALAIVVTMLVMTLAGSGDASSPTQAGPSATGSADAGTAASSSAPAGSAKKP